MKVSMEKSIKAKSTLKFEEDPNVKEMQEQLSYLKDRNYHPPQTFEEQKRSFSPKRQYVLVEEEEDLNHRQHNESLRQTFG
mmetsp:Transcript_26182/g.19671  ORF Transcript_26182/g.19671 Transcript_26182/m.19671 type:complete len:81 (+) Transcript_26182:1-243(+)